MPTTAVTVDSHRVTGMLDGLSRRAQDLILERAAENALGTITGIPEDTGELANSPYVKVGGNDPYAARVRIVSDVEYAKFVFHGHATRGDSYVDAQPPKLGYTAQDLADDVAREIGLTI
jgi:hypothetical protein